MSEHVKQAKIKKPETYAALSSTDDNQPLPLHGTLEIPSSMERTRTGIQDCPEVWGDRTFGRQRHAMAKPADTGK
jgi:hypothetical protein